MEMPNSNFKNLASVVLQNGGTTSDSTITMPTASASVFPATPFYATIMLTSVLANSSNSEIVYVTGSTTSGSNTIFSITRAQRNTSAISWSAGEAVLTHAIYREDVAAQSQGYYNAVLGSGTAFTITNASAPTSPSLGDKIRVLFDTPIATASSITLAINGGTPYTISSVGTTFVTATTLNTSLTLSDDIVYDLVFTGNNWTLQNESSLVGVQDITADIPIIGSSTSLPTNLVFVRTNNIEDGAVTADKIEYSEYGNGVTKVIGTDITDNTPVYRSIFVIDGTVAIPTGTWVDIGNLFSGNYNVKTVYKLDLIVRDSGGDNFTSYGYDGAATTVNTFRPFVARVKKNGTVQMTSVSDNFSTPKIIMVVEYTTVASS